MSEMKCPICGTKLEHDIGYDGDYSCAKCGRAKMFGSEELWQALTDSMKEHDLCHDALVERTKELDHTRKALEMAKDALYWYADENDPDGDPVLAIERLKEITALEKKENNDDRKKRT